MKAPSMSKTLAGIALAAITVLLVLDFVTILAELPAKQDLLTLTGVLLSWQVVAGGLAVGGAATFRNEIKARILRPPTGIKSA
jgi:hypothetical protein